MADGRKSRVPNSSLEQYLKEISETRLLTKSESEFYLRFIRTYLKKNPKVLIAEEVIESPQMRVSRKGVRFRETFESLRGVLPTSSLDPITELEKQLAARYLDELLHRNEDYSEIISPKSPEEAKKLFLDLPSDEHRYSAAASKIWGSNLGLVVLFAKEENCRLSLEEKISLGNTGLKRAILRYDLSKGSSFSTYAAWWIKKQIRDGRKENKLIRTPPGSKYAKLRRPLSIDATYKDEDYSLVNTLHDPCAKESSERLVDEENRGVLYRLLSYPILTPREKEVLTLLYGLRGSSSPGESKTIEEAVLRLGISRQRIQAVRDKAISKLRRHFIY